MAALLTTTDASEQNNTGPLGGPVINNVRMNVLKLHVRTNMRYRLPVADEWVLILHLTVVRSMLQELR